MNLFKKGISIILLLAVVVSCEEDDLSSTPTGLSEIIFSSFSATPSQDGTLVTVNPVTIGASSYIVDFGDANSSSDVITINSQSGSASYDYPNVLASKKYTITVTAKSEGKTDVVKTKDVTVKHTVDAIPATAPSPTKNHADVFGIYSDGMKISDGFLGYSDIAALSADKIVTTEDGNKAIQFSRLTSSGKGEISFGTSAKPESITVSKTFGTGIASTHLHLDVHSAFAQGIDKLKITLINGDNNDEYVIDNVDLTDDAWTGLDLDLATDFSAPVVRIDEMRFELGSAGTAKDHATINVDNIYVYKAPATEIVNGNFDLKTVQWKIASFTGGTTNPFNDSSDGSWYNYDGTLNTSSKATGSKTKGAKWTSSTSGGPMASAKSRYAYQALTLTPNTDYIFEFEYAIKNDNAQDPVGGRRMVGVILDGHFTDGVDAVAAEGKALGSHAGYIAEGKFSATRGTKVLVDFTSNSSGKVAVWLYGVTPKDGWFDNVKVYKK